MELAELSTQDRERMDREAGELGRCMPREALSLRSSQESTDLSCEASADY